MIGIIDYGMGNLLSVKNALDYLGEESEIINDADSIRKVKKIVLPGVGSFPDCMNNLNERGFVEILNELVLEKKIPILGICLGMQIMGETSHEMGESEGLGWFEGDVIKMEPQNESIKIPNIGWETISIVPGDHLLSSFNTLPDFYFVHSYYLKCSRNQDVTSTYLLGDQIITASIQKDNIYGTQFHPEKSSDHGLEVLTNFIEIKIDG